MLDANFGYIARVPCWPTHSRSLARVSFARSLSVSRARAAPLVRLRGRSLTAYHVVGRTARPVRLLAGVVGPTGLLGLCVGLCGSVRVRPL